jgi:hypothetical protein
MTPDDINRRKFVRNTGLGALLFNVAGIPTLLTPRAAYSKGVTLQTLSAEEGLQLANFADHLLPGAAAAGVTQFVDQQLDIDPQECLLMCKYFPDIKAPFLNFYRNGIGALSNASSEKFGKPFGELTLEQKNVFTDSLWRGDVSGWSGPPPPLFYMMVRSDAVDVVYGTKEGFDELNIPYMAHIMPEEKW